MGKFSKPQKSNKHKKLKFVDPFYHGERKERMHAGHNLDPATLEQGVSRSMKHLMRRTEQAKELNKKSRRQKKEILKNRMLAQISTKGAEREVPEIPEFRKKKGEKQGDFMQRVDATTMMAVKESQIEATFKTERDPVLEEKQKSSKKKEKLQMKKKAKKEKEKAKMEDRADDFHKFKDKVEFGEVTHGPPNLTVRPRHATTQQKPAAKSLLLYDVLKKNNSEDNSLAAKPSKAQGKSVKRKFLSPSQKIKLDKERQNAVDLYRQMKKNNVVTS